MLLAITIWIITIVTAILFAGRFWWFPEVASEHGPAIDRQFVYTLVVTGIVFVIAQIGLGYVVMHYRDRPGRTARYTHGNDRLEVVWTLATTVLFFSLVIVGQNTWVDLYLKAAPRDALRIEVTAQQFQWNVRYPGADGQFGGTRTDLIDDSAANYIGLDDQDPAAQDDITLQTMAVPVNRPVEIILRSKDVTHGFFVRELRIKQDAVPGLEIPIRFKATRIGTYEIACAELCGLGHHNMRSTLEVLSEDDYAGWLEERAEE
jgi:cytochrome c oxidase subunit 2